MSDPSGAALPEPRCPLCGGPNGCAAVASGGVDAACWCAQETFPAGLLQRLPADVRGRACICRRCVQAQALDGPEPACSTGAHHAPVERLTP